MGPLNLESSLEHFRGSFEFLSQDVLQIDPGVPELGSDKQTNEQRLLLYKYRLYVSFHLNLVNLQFSFRMRNKIN